MEEREEPVSAEDEENLTNGNDVPEFTYATDDKSETKVDELLYSEQMDYKEAAEY